MKTCEISTRMLFLFVNFKEKEEIVKENHKNSWNTDEWVNSVSGFERRIEKFYRKIIEICEISTEVPFLFMNFKEKYKILQKNYKNL